MLIASDSLKIVIGLGKTGLSCARYLAKQGVNFSLADTRDLPPNLEQIKSEFPQCEIRLGELSADFLCNADTLYLSPGVGQSDPAIVAAVEAGVKLSGDIDLFCQAVSAPIVAITGSNAKSTVTSLVGDMAKHAGLQVGVGGNLGTPVLDMLDEDEKELYVLELSSFQLETTNDLRAKVATVLNISPDHMDRYNNDMSAYHGAKHRIFRGCQSAVENKDDLLTHPLLPSGIPLTAYRLGKADIGVFGLLDDNGQECLALGNDPIMPTSSIRMPGRHNVANALSALALGKAVGLPMDAMVRALESFGGLEHRCEWVAEKSGVNYFNDSKGTNVGATVAALDGLGPDLKANGSKIVLIAGGDGKGAEFDDLLKPVQSFVSSVVLIGKDADKIESTLSGIHCIKVSDLDEAVSTAASLAKTGDTVLLSPACASLDMFKNYSERGHLFVNAVENLSEGGYE